MSRVHTGAPELFLVKASVHDPGDPGPGSPGSLQCRHVSIRWRGPRRGHNKWWRHTRGTPGHITDVWLMSPGASFRVTTPGQWNDISWLAAGWFSCRMDRMIKVHTNIKEGLPPNDSSFTVSLSPSTSALHIFMPNGTLLFIRLSKLIGGGSNVFQSCNENPSS